VLMVLFFVLTAVAATGAMLSLMEVPVVILHERLGMSRSKAILITLVLLMVAGSGAALSHSTLSEFKVAGMTLFELADYLSSNILLPIGGIFIALFLGWFWGSDQFRQALSNQGQLANAGVAKAIFFLLRYVSPALILLVMLQGLGLI